MQQSRDCPGTDREWRPGTPANALLTKTDTRALYSSLHLGRREEAMSNATSLKGSEGSMPNTIPAVPRPIQLAPVLVVENVEPCLRFWVERLGFKPVNEVPGPDGKLIFASAVKEGVEVMYQTRASVIAERPDSAAELKGHSAALYITVEDLDPFEKAVAEAPVVKARHKTFYGTVEIYVREPGGNIVGFAQKL
jgi:catechol 2,3-dioxygenase-like lactoylglutathione lyase family enzyme